ncbi:MAG: hypothetical protein IIA45_14805 [Bacteroidetes bacterium]|nr:hypothetical protein [Bacteroidota bacterium]
MKFVCSGAIKIRNKDLGLIAFDLKIKSTKTVKKHLQILVEKNWLGYIPSSHTYVVRGFEKIRMMEGFKTRSAAEFCFCDMDKFKAFLAGALISYLVNFQKRKERECERVNKGRSNHHSHNFLPFYPIANLALAKILNVSISTAFSLKLKARKAKFIAIKKNYSDTGIDYVYISEYKKYNPEEKKRIIVKDKKIFLLGPDLVLPGVRFKSRKKIETYIKGL